MRLSTKWAKSSFGVEGLPKIRALLSNHIDQAIANKIILQSTFPFPKNGISSHTSNTDATEDGMHQDTPLLYKKQQNETGILNVNKKVINNLHLLTT